jgi:XTP/dITP diphosphohydrolase
MQRLLLATRNVHKTREIQEILGSGFAVKDLTTCPEITEAVESGMTFEENATIKALAVAKICPGLVVADDSGLEVDALGGAPGIFSARYAGEKATDSQNMAKLLEELARRKVRDEQRTARFRCVIALARDGELLGIFEGAVEGSIVPVARGDGGFGYDPIFVPAGLRQTFAELPPAEKNRISHRARAMLQLAAFLKTQRHQC